MSNVLLKRVGTVGTGLDLLHLKFSISQVSTLCHDSCQSINMIPIPGLQSIGDPSEMSMPALIFDLKPDFIYRIRPDPPLSFS